MFGLCEVIKTIGHALAINWTNLLNQYGVKKNKSVHMWKMKGQI